MRKPVHRSMWRHLMGAALLSAVGVSAAAAQGPDSENGRFTMSPIPGGVIRLDTRTGTVSTCMSNDSGWACHAVPDERAAFDAEIGRLQKDNDALRAELAARGTSDPAAPKADAPGPKVAEGERKIEIPLPSDRDLDRMMTVVEGAWRRLLDLASRLQRDAGGKI